MIHSPDFRYNTKCVLQGFFVLGVWYAAYNRDLPKPEMQPKSVLFALFLFWITYFVNAIMDHEFGCDHGDFYRQLTG